MSNVKTKSIFRTSKSSSNGGKSAAVPPQNDVQAAPHQNNVPNSGVSGYFSANKFTNLFKSPSNFVQSLNGHISFGIASNAPASQSTSSMAVDANIHTLPKSKSKQKNNAINSNGICGDELKQNKGEKKNSSYEDISKKTANTDGQPQVCSISGGTYLFKKVKLHRGDENSSSSESEPKESKPKIQSQNQSTQQSPSRRKQQPQSQIPVKSTENLLNLNRNSTSTIPIKPIQPIQMPIKPNINLNMRINNPPSYSSIINQAASSTITPLKSSATTTTPPSINNNQQQSIHTIQPLIKPKDYLNLNNLNIRWESVIFGLFSLI